MAFGSFVNLAISLGLCPARAKMMIAERFRCSMTCRKRIEPLISWKWHPIQILKHAKYWRENHISTHLNKSLKTVSIYLQDPVYHLLKTTTRPVRTGVTGQNHPPYRITPGGETVLGQNHPLPEILTRTPLSIKAFP